MILSSRPPRNRYRRRPSRLTALGKVVVASCGMAILAIGWASQASRRPLGSEASPDVAVSAPPRWTGPPKLGAFAAPEPARAEKPSLSSNASSGVDSDRPVPRDAPPAALLESPSSLDPSVASALPGESTPASPRTLAQPIAPPVSRARFEKVRAEMRVKARSGRSLPPPVVASLAAGAGSDSAISGSRTVDGTSGRRQLSEWVDAASLGRVQAEPAFERARAAGARAEGSWGDVRLDYSLDAELTEAVFEILRQGRVERGIAIVIEPATGRVLAYAATDPSVLPVERAYPAASIVKVVTAAAMLERRADPSSWDCVYEGNKYRLTARRLDRPKRGNHASLEDAMASSNNQCFSQWAIHGLGEPRLRRMLDAFGWSGGVALGHARGRVEPAETRFDLGQLGSGLDGVRVTALHVASLASVLANGRLVEPRWIDRVVDANGALLEQPRPAPPRRVVGPQTARTLREVMVATTKRGTARRAFRSRRGIPVLGSIEVAGKTGNLNGSDPAGRYEWFFGVAPARDPQIGVVVLQVHGHLWWARSSELAANILRRVFCEGASCRSELATRFTGPLEAGPISPLDAEGTPRSAPPQFAAAARGRD